MSRVFIRIKKTTIGIIGISGYISFCQFIPRIFIFLLLLYIFTHVDNTIYIQ